MVAESPEIEAARATLSRYRPHTYGACECHCRPTIEIAGRVVLETHNLAPEEDEAARALGETAPGVMAWSFEIINQMVRMANVVNTFPTLRNTVH